MNHNEDLRIRIRDFLSEIDSAEDLYKLFKLLNYPEKNLFDASSKRKIEEFDFRKDERDKIKTIYTVLSFEKDLSVFLIEVKSLSPSFIRYVAKVFSDRYLRLLLIFTTNYEDFVFVFPQFQKVETGKHKLYITRLVLNKSETYYTDIETLSNLFYDEETTWRDVWLKWKKAFNVKRVTDKFFGSYSDEFLGLRNKLIAQGIHKKDAHAFSLLFLNRIMFIYFISKKRWLNNDPKFMRWFWRRYLQERSKGALNENSFYDTWLKPLFFEAFNGSKDKIFERNLPDDLKKVLGKAPYLNGSLFREDKELDRLPIRIEDALFKSIFEFFEQYNFTIKEDMPLDQEVAVDPQMIGYVYEALANVAEEIYDANDLGIFYTPRVEVDFMCRRSLVEYLDKSLPQIPKSRIYEFLFDEDREKVEKYFEEEKCWYELEEVLDNLSVVDPACGSGAFLVGMLNALTELYKIIYKHISIKRDFRDFELKKRIINRSLYGVDVMSWALGAAELRLWLQLIIESDLKVEDLQKEPLLPNLDINLRVGDSLVQEIGGITLHLRDSNISDRLKKKLDNLKSEKEKYFCNPRMSKFTDKGGIIKEEARIFEEIVKERVSNLEKKVKSLKEEIDKLKRVKQINLSGTVSEGEQQKIFDVRKEKERELEGITKGIEELEKIKAVLNDPEKKPFVWDIDFAEIFGDKNGFDIVIGNPPYVRQEKISPPDRLKEDVTLDDRKEYKEKLIKSVVAHLSVIEKIDRKSDYYIYFYLHGLSLLNERGSFCFITSNSWLDVGYGKGLQEFLLKYVPIHAIYDNQAKRSFEHADVNTIIALFGAPAVEEGAFGSLMIQRDKRAYLKNTAKFVMFKKSFEEVINTKNLLEIENATEVLKRDDFRVYPITHRDLLEDGWEYPEGYDPKKDGFFKKGNYAGNKWGGKYLRAPDIFFTILKKGKTKIKKFSQIGKIRRGFTCGINEFFYLSEDLIKKFKIEKEFIQKVIKSPREYKEIILDKKKASSKVFICNKNRSELKGTNALKYIEWGEKQKTKESIFWNKVSTVQVRDKWYKISKNDDTDLIIPRTFNDAYLCYLGCANHSDRFYGIRCRMKNSLCVYLNSFVFILLSESLAKQGLGLGALDLNIREFVKLPFILPPEKNYQNTLKKRKNRSVFEDLKINPSKPIREQEPRPLPDRAELDNIIFDELDLTEDERKEVYWAVCELIKQRLEKARSFKKG